MASRISETPERGLAVYRSAGSIRIKLGLSWASLEPSWAIFCQLETNLEPDWSNLEPLVTNLIRLGTNLKPAWDQFGATSFSCSHILRTLALSPVPHSFFPLLLPPHPLFPIYRLPTSWPGGMRGAIEYGQPLAR